MCFFITTRLFYKKEKERIKSNWNKISRYSNHCGESRNSKWDVYNKLKAIIRTYTSQDRRAATNRLVASLQPNLISTIVNESDLGDLINKINTYTTSNISLDGGWCYV
jgi:5-methylcytosine-specific restriction protein B